MRTRRLLHLFLLLVFQSQTSTAQPEVTAWGNFVGIRVEGQLMSFQSRLMVVGNDWFDPVATAKEQQKPRYVRDGDRQIVTTTLGDAFSFTETVTDIGSGRARVDVQLMPDKDTTIIGSFFSVRIHKEKFIDGTVRVIDPVETQLSRPPNSHTNEILRTAGLGVSFKSAEQRLQITTDTSTLIIMRKGNGHEEEIEVLMRIAGGMIRAGEIHRRTFTIRVEEQLNRAKAMLSLNYAEKGRPFDGFGGNFRLQNPVTDPQVIDYCLDNMRLAWGRVEMPWMLWQPDENSDPLTLARNDSIDERVRAAMEMAQRLHRKGISVIVSAWTAPDWAILSEPSLGSRIGSWGNPLNPEKRDKIYKSIGDYIAFLKERYHVDVAMFSLNESDLGIHVRQTGAEHRDLIKGLGAHFKSRGLNTKLLLGDTADANGWPFLNESIEDKEALQHVGAVSFHSWRGCDSTTLKRWAKIAHSTGKPLIVGEGSVDAAAWNYPEIFEELIYQLEEINLYMRILAICEPASILQWQLTADYSPMAGGGIYGDDEPLRPTQRFFCMKQLSSTPAGLFNMPITSNHPEVIGAAFGDNAKKTYALHIVNNGARRMGVVTGFPKNVKRLSMFVTNSDRGMERLHDVEVQNGRAEITLEEVSFVTLITH